RIPFSAYLFVKYAQDTDAPYAPEIWGEALNEEQFVAQARRMIEAYAFKSIKLKAAALQPEHEVSSIKAIKKAFPANPLRIDPN
ncbi:enolase C-terminal domain-like protein, partial [Pseudomonas syringae group genomosp. 7]|uniref:enolase C-terminal domain-like protein n=1 Tax=Pseudomonas syringae group genomosp. 7 TaxID=251699 RepID=UPI0037704901